MSRGFALGLVITRHGDMEYYALDAWVMANPQQGVERVVFDHLTWDELTDVVDVWLDTNRVKIDADLGQQQVLFEL